MSQTHLNGSDFEANMAKRIPILAYHSILQEGRGALPDSWQPLHTVPYRSFCTQLDLLKTGNWGTLPVEALNDPSIWNSRIKQVLITFDDGHDSDLLAAAALAVRGFTAAFFIPWAHIGQAHFLDRSGVKQLNRDGFRIGSHGMTHCRLTAISKEQLWQELTESKARLEDLVGLPVRDLAIPFGSYNQRVIDTALSAGYANIMTSDIGQAMRASKSRGFPRLPVKSFTTSADLLTLVGGSAFAVFRWRLAKVLAQRVRVCFGSYA